MTNDIAVLQSITLLFKAYKQLDDKERMKIYVNRFREFPANIVRTACQKVIDEQEFMPSIAHIVKAIKSLSETASERQLGFDEVYADIQRELYRCAGTNRKPEFKSVAAENLVSTIGWGTLITATNREASVIRAQMRQIFEQQAFRKHEQQTNRYLLAKNGVDKADFPNYIGYHDVSNGGLIGISDMLKSHIQPTNSPQTVH